MSYIVNSAPGAGYKYQPSTRFENAIDALLCARELTKRGMRLVRIVDTATGVVYEEAALRAELKNSAST